ncbi:uncharacterized protein LOC110459975 [Mizuhopecten yessoensis]|uniref:uncharacterized protein LOC110459975 n=1 Tax=Mizuhopecten yessoensis TaxID=6573 RepID=UPI000B459FD5|nr:uncharacterized protein LOC110459975 [Mizuhopecten yessoensis]XP_021368276.1 uncharacterized protein LOC110459975 [Mizuhopecten yessoensis]XP_021368287.1 uncharacterized protein LOC110459975 [Mizuhopecten yessoensis]
MTAKNYILMLLPIMNGLLYTHASKDTLQQVQRDFWKWHMRDSPQFMTATGFNKYNDLLESMNISMFEQRKTAVDEFLTRLASLPVKELTYRQRVDYDILQDYLQTFVDGYRWRDFLALNPINFIEGIQSNPQAMVDITPFISHGDFINYLARLKDLPKMVDEIIDRLKKAIEVQHTHHLSAIKAVPGQIDAFLKSEPSDLILFKPFNTTLDNIMHISEETKSHWRSLARNYCSDVIDAFVKLKNFVVEKYMENTRKHIGVGSWREGKEFYRACLKFHLSVDMTPEEVFKLGQDEVARILKRMKKVMKKLEYEGSVREFFDMLKLDEGLQRANADEVLMEYRSIYKYRIKPALSKYFENLPDKPLRIVSLPSDGPQGLYMTGSKDGERPGTFYVNTNRPQSHPTFTFMALTLHEAEPGHHFQLSYAAQSKLPEYRRHLEITKYFQVPFNFPFYTAYVEGWGLYAEYLGEELGLYQDDYEMMGRYSFEIFRACRLVIDTGIHYFNWSRDQAIGYMMNHTAMPLKTVEKEIDRYTMMPGQACAYKVGEIKIRQIRERAKRLLGDAFDVRKFHTVVLENGPMPLRVLESVVDNWVKLTKETAQSVMSHTECGSPINSAVLSKHSTFMFIIVCILFLCH